MFHEAVLANDLLSINSSDHLFKLPWSLSNTPMHIAKLSSQLYLKKEALGGCDHRWKNREGIRERRVIVPPLQLLFPLQGIFPGDVCSVDWQLEGNIVTMT